MNGQLMQHVKPEQGTRQVSMAEALRLLRSREAWDYRFDGELGENNDLVITGLIYFERPGSPPCDTSTIEAIFEHKAKHVEAVSFTGRLAYSTLARDLLLSAFVGAALGLLASGVTIGKLVGCL